MNGSITYDVNGKEMYAIHNGVYCVKKTVDMSKAEISDYQGYCGLETNPKCFAFSNGSITNYYDNEENDSSKKECPRDVVIPETINGVTVTKIGYIAFRSKNITSVTLPGSIESIENYAFAYTKLSGELDLSTYTSLTSIGEYAFTGSSNGSTNQITSVKFPDSLESIGGYAFGHNKLSGELDLSNTKITSIEGDTFIGYAYGSTNQITSIKLPTSVTSIGSNAFADNKISGELDLSYLTSLVNIEAKAFLGSTNGSTNQISSLKLPSSITSILDGAFNYNVISGELDLSNLTNLKRVSGFLSNEITNIKLPTSVTNIGNYAFADNKLSGELDLSHLTSLTRIQTGAFLGKKRENNQITSVKLPISLEIIDDQVFKENAITGELDLRNLTKLTSIAKEAFYLNSITDLKLANSLTKLGDSVFKYNPLTSVTFYGRSDLTGVTVGSNAWGWASGYNADNNIYFVNE